MTASSPTSTKAPAGLHGGCYCGQVRYEVDAVFDAGWCHCSICRRISGAPAVAWFNVREEHFRLLQGAPAELASSAHFSRWFCRDCGTHLYGHDDQPAPATVGSRLVSLMHGTLDRPGDVPLQVHQWFGSRSPEWDRAAALPTFDTGTLPHPDKRR